MKPLEELEKAAALGLKITVKLIQKFSTQKQIEDKFRQLIYAMMKSRPDLCDKLIDGDILPDQFVALDHADLQSEDLKQKQKEIREQEMQARRTDVVRQHLRENAGSSL